MVQKTLFLRNNYYIFCFLWRCGPTWAMASSFTRFLDHTQRRITVSRTPLDEWSARRRDLYLTSHNTHNSKTPMPPSGIRTHNLSRREAADLRLIPRGHWDRQLSIQNPYICDILLFLKDGIIRRDKNTFVVICPLLKTSNFFLNYPQAVRDERKQREVAIRST